MSLSYEQQLKHPLWQKKRLEIMKRDLFTCIECESQDQQLHVHHKFYKKNTLLWEYPDESLSTLCWACHKKADAMREELKVKLGCLGLHDIKQVVGYVNGLRAWDDSELIVTYDDICDATGLGHAFEISDRDVLNFNPQILAKAMEAWHKVPPAETLRLVEERKHNSRMLQAKRRINFELARIRKGK